MLLEAQQCEGAVPLAWDDLGPGKFEDLCGSSPFAVDPVPAQILSCHHELLVHNLELADMLVPFGVVEVDHAVRPATWSRRRETVLDADDGDAAVAVERAKGLEYVPHLAHGIALDKAPADVADPSVLEMHMQARSLRGRSAARVSRSETAEVHRPQCRLLHHAVQLLEWPNFASRAGDLLAHVFQEGLL